MIALNWKNAIFRLQRGANYFFPQFTATPTGPAPTMNFSKATNSQNVAVISGLIS